MSTGGYPAAGPAGGAKWLPVTGGQKLPRGAVRAGWTKSDGPTYVGIAEDDDGVIGKINTSDPDNCGFHKFWAHGYWRGRKEAKILVLDDSCVAVWTPIERDDPIPSNAVQTAMAMNPGKTYDNESLREAQEKFFSVMAKLGQEKHGCTFVGRFNGEPGSVEVKSDVMHSFWGHYWGEQVVAEILTLEPAAGLQAAAAPRLLCAAAASAPPEASNLSNTTPAVVPTESVPFRIKVLQFNIWQEGWEVAEGFDRIVDVCIAAEADLVTFSEVRNWWKNCVPVPFVDFHSKIVKRMKERSGVSWYGSWVAGCDSGFISKFPVEFAENVTEAKRSFISSYNIRTPAGPLCVCSAHLDWKNYALNLIRGYDADTFRKLSAPVTDDDKLLAMDELSGRNQSLKDFVRHAKAQTCPTILGGDFNECSHLDWTPAMKDMYGHNGVSIEWKHSKLLIDSGFKDSWRELYPDPTTHMGATWPSQAHEKECTSWAKDADERDRIDFIYYNSTATTTLKPIAGYLVGPKGYFKFGKPADSNECACPFLSSCLNINWPSDHKAILVEFEMTSQA